MNYQFGGELDELMDAARVALKTGNRDDARDYLEQVLENSEYNEDAWFLMHQAVDTDAERRICLENVLELNPEHDEARALLNQLNGGAETDPLFGDFDPFGDASEAPALKANAAPARAKKARPRSGRLANNRRLLTVLMVLLALGTLVMVTFAVLLAANVI